jgi:hypothetical protein
MMLLTAIYHGEENRDALRRVVRVSFWAELILTGSLSVLIYFFAPQITRLYLGNNLDAHADGILSLRWYAAGLLFQGFNILFADYLQSTRRIQPANLVYILENVVFTVLAVTWLSGTDSAEHVYRGVAAAHLLMFLTIPVFVMIRNRKPLPVYGKGENVRDWLFVEDHARAIDVIFHGGKIAETYNIGGFNEWKNIDIIKVVIRTTDRLLGRAEDEDMNLITYVTDRLGHDARYAIDSTKLQKELGWEPSLQFEEGIERTIKWYLENEEWLDNVTSGDYLNYYDTMYGKTE